MAFFITSIIPPNIPLRDDDIYVATETGDRLDTLANQFYGNSELWWVIATYNNLTDIDIKLEPGLQLRIPNRSSVVTQLF